MKVILLADVKGQGKKNEVIDVESTDVTSDEETCEEEN